MLAIREAGLAIPGDVAVVGYDDVPTAAFACPPLTTVRTHAYEHGKLLAEAAIRLMNIQEVGNQENVLPLELVVRMSCGAKPAKATLPRQRSSARAPQASSRS
jgi:LacI family transcriptional regulator